MTPKRSWSRSEVERIVSDAMGLYEEQRIGRGLNAHVSHELVEADVAGSLDYDETVWRRNFDLSDEGVEALESVVPPVKGGK